MRVGNIIAENRAHNAQLDLLHCFAIAGGIAAGARHFGREKENPFGLGFEDAALDQPSKSLIAELIASLGRMRDPEINVVRLRFLRDVG